MIGCIPANEIVHDLFHPRHVPGVFSHCPGDFLLGGNKGFPKTSEQFVGKPYQKHRNQNGAAQIDKNLDKFVVNHKNLSLENN
jgi:hypothetical protein